MEGPSGGMPIVRGGMPIALDGHDVPVGAEDEQDASAQDAPDPEVTIETALRWLQELKPNLAIALLKQPQLALQATRAFLGFRFNAQGYQNPIVRRRLADEIVRDPKLQEVFRTVIEMKDQAEADPTTVGSPDPQVLEPQRAGVGSDSSDAPLIDNLKDQLRAERDARKREKTDSRATIDELKKINADLVRDLAERSAALAEAVAEADSLRDAVAKANQKVAKVERQNTRLKVEADLLARAATKAPRANKPSTPPITVDQPTVDTRSPFEAAAYRLVSQENLDSALALAEATLIEDPGNAGALRIAAEVYQKTGDRDRAALTARDLTLAELGDANLKSATEAFFLLLTADPMSSLIPTASKPYIQALKFAGNDELQALRTTFARFNSAHPAVYRRLTRLIDEYVPADIARILTRPSATGPNEPLPLQLPAPLTATAIVEAVDRSDEAVVDKLRVALNQLRTANPDDYGRCISAIADAAGDDESYLKPLIGRTRGPAIVDASNVAWYDDSKGMADRPRLHQVLKVRAAMRQRGYFPVLLIGDAPLPHTVDDRDAFARMMATGEVTLSTTGTDADETILREAKRLGATVVSNDYMADWDPDDEVPKIRYVIPNTGPAYLLG